MTIPATAAAAAVANTAARFHLRADSLRRNACSRRASTSGEASMSPLLSASARNAATILSSLIQYSSPRAPHRAAQLLDEDRPRPIQPRANGSHRTLQRLCRLLI